MTRGSSGISARAGSFVGNSAAQRIFWSPSRKGRSVCDGLAMNRFTSGPLGQRRCAFLLLGRRFEAKGPQPVVPAPRRMVGVRVSPLCTEWLQTNQAPSERSSSAVRLVCRNPRGHSLLQAGDFIGRQLYWKLFLDIHCNSIVPLRNGKLMPKARFQIVLRYTFA